MTEFINLKASQWKLWIILKLCTKHSNKSGCIFMSKIDKYIQFELSTCMFYILHSIVTDNKTTCMEIWFDYFILELYLLI